MRSRTVKRRLIAYTNLTECASTEIRAKGGVAVEILLGYCCVSTLYPKLKCSRSSTKTYLDSHDAKACHDYLLDKARKNLFDMAELLKYNKDNGILAYRMPEQVLPQLDLGYYKIEELQTELRMVGKIANQLGIQLSQHPSQYYVLNSHRQDVVEKSIHTLDFFAETMEAMELTKVPNMTLHIGVKNGYEDSTEAVKAFAKNFERLGEPAKKYLVVENDHVSFQVEDCLKVHELTGVPVVFDNKHYEWNPGDMTFEESLNAAVHTWGSRTPKLHLSSDKEGIKKHAHHEMVFLEDYKKMEQAAEKSGIKQCYFMLECKQKDIAVLELYEKIKK